MCVFTYLNIWEFEGNDCLEDVLGELCEGIIAIKFANSKVNEVPCDAIYIDVHKGVKILEWVLVNVTTPSLLLGQALSQLQVLNRNFRSLLKNNEPVYVPGVEPKPTASVVDHLSQKLKDEEDHLIIVDEALERFGNNGEVIGVEPVEEEGESLLCIETVNYALEDIEQLYKLSLDIWVRFHRRFIKREELLDNGIKLGYVAFEIFNKIFMNPEAGQYLEKVS